MERTFKQSHTKYTLFLASLLCKYSINTQDTDITIRKLFILLASLLDTTQG